MEEEGKNPFLMENSPISVATIVCVCLCVRACMRVCVCVCVLKYSGSSFISLNGKVCPLGTPTKAKVKKKLIGQMV